MLDLFGSPASQPRVRVIHGDCLVEMAKLDAESVDAVVTDPPYELNFMSKNWDNTGVAFRPDTWRAVMRVLKPGGHLLAFGGSRTFHRVACAIEDAGFELRDTIMWVYGCLDTATQVATVDGVKSHTQVTVGDLVLCYDAATGNYSHQPVQEIVEYEYDDVAFRLTGDRGEQVVSRNHRVIVERYGAESFVLAETIGDEARIPFLEDLSGLQRAVCDAQSRPGEAEQDLQCRVPVGPSEAAAQEDAAGRAEGPHDRVRGMREVDLATERVAESQGVAAGLQPAVQRCLPGRGLEGACTQGARSLDGREPRVLSDEDDRPEQSGLGRRRDIPQPEGALCEPVDQVRALPTRVRGDGSSGQLRDRIPTSRREGDRARADAGRGGAPRGPRRDEQRGDEPDALRDQRSAQGVRAWRGHKADLVRVVPFHYVGKVWCLQVPTGAFVAVRGGIAFPTGNSGFPKSLDVSKALDKAAGAERERPKHEGMTPFGGPGFQTCSWCGKSKGGAAGNCQCPKSGEPITDAARQWSGWGTALKPAFEPIVVARKPLSEPTVAANVLRHGTGAINVDACRIEAQGRPLIESKSESSLNTFGNGINGSRNAGTTDLGRWPANLVHDNSDEVLACFPEGRSAGIYGNERNKSEGALFGTRTGGATYDDKGSAARFFKACEFTEEERQQQQGRWPANLVHDGSEEVLACFPETTSNSTGKGKDRGIGFGGSAGASFLGPRPTDTGSAARFFKACEFSDDERRLFYSSKASRAERNGSKHPTVKPLTLLRYLCRLVTPPGGVVLDPFSGSGTTLAAALAEGFRCIGIEREAEYVEDIHRRIGEHL